MIGKTYRRVKRRVAKQGGKGGRTLFWAAIALSILAGCANVQEREARKLEMETYEAALKQRVQSYVYQMSCAALLPLARDQLWEQGYEELPWESEGEGVLTQWKEHDEMRRSRYLVHSNDVGLQRCAVQFVRDDETGEQVLRRRDPRQELTFLDRVDPEGAQSVRFEARQEADEAYRQYLERYEAGKAFSPARR